MPPNAQLVEYLKKRCKAANVDFDTYDLDFILGCVMQWLLDHNTILSEVGVERA